MTYHLTTFGCQMNYSDSERIAAVFENMNIKSAEQNKADILIFNLCSVRQHAVDKVWGMLKNIKTFPPKADQPLAEKHKNPPAGDLPKGDIKTKSFVILTGCILPTDKKKFKDKIDLILDIKDLSNWPKEINKLFTHYSLPAPCYSLPDNYFSIQPSRFSAHTAYVPIMTGCNNFCSYCAVPYTRGKEYSRPAEEILNEVNKLVVQGYKEIILLGQNVNSYQSTISNDFLLSSRRKSGSQCLQNIHEIPASAGMTKKGTGMTKDDIVNFPTLLKIIDSIPGNYWLSFLTSHPKDMSGKLIKCFKDCKHLMSYLHLPLQSGSDKILKEMNRKYTAKQYLDLIRGIRKAIRNISISTDIIVGFPGETKKDFEATTKVMKKIKFDMAYLAEYSPRPGTVAAKLKDNVSKSEKAKRKNILNEILKHTALENNQKLVGKIETVLVESVKNNFAFGHTKMMKNVKINMPIVCHSRPRSESGAGSSGNPEIKNKRNLIGKFVKVKITKAGAWGMEGEIKRESSW